MKKLASVTIIIAGLSACAQPEPIQDYNAPYTGKYSAPVVPPRPEPRPSQRMWYACPNAQVNDDCGNGEISDVTTDSVVEPPVSQPPVAVVPDVPISEPDPVAPELPEQPAPEPVEPEPEVHEPPPEVHEPPEEWCPND